MPENLMLLGYTASNQGLYLVIPRLFIHPNTQHRIIMLVICSKSMKGGYFKGSPSYSRSQPFQVKIKG